jgi:hypothetical protein
VAGGSEALRFPWALCWTGLRGEKRPRWLLKSYGK